MITHPNIFWPEGQQPGGWWLKPLTHSHTEKPPSQKTGPVHRKEHCCQNPRMVWVSGQLKRTKQPALAFSMTALGMLAVDKQLWQKWTPLFLAEIRILLPCSTPSLTRDPLFLRVFKFHPEFLHQKPIAVTSGRGKHAKGNRNGSLGSPIE